MVEQQPVMEQPKRRNDRLIRILLSFAAVIFVVIVAVAAFAIGRETNNGTSEAAPSATTEATTGDYNYDILNEIHDLLHRYYVNPSNLDDQSLFEAAVNGMLDILSDAGTYYVPPDINQRSTLLTGSFEGIGATISSDNNEIVIVAPIKDTPAARAGLVSGDVIEAVDGESMQGLDGGRSRAAHPRRERHAGRCSRSVTRTARRRTSRWSATRFSSPAFIQTRRAAP